jgi:hypothetical protein
MEIFLKYTKLSFSLASAACTYFSLHLPAGVQVDATEKVVQDPPLLKKI